MISTINTDPLKISSWIMAAFKHADEMAEIDKLTDALPHKQGSEQNKPFMEKIQMLRVQDFLAAQCVRLTQEKAALEQQLHSRDTENKNAHMRGDARTGNSRGGGTHTEF